MYSENIPVKISRSENGKFLPSRMTSIKFNPRVYFGTLLSSYANNDNSDGKDVLLVKRKKSDE